MQRDLQSQMEELEEENEHLKKQHMMASEAKTKLRQETSQLTAENMVGATSGGVQSDRATDMCF